MEDYEKNENEKKEQKFKKIKTNPEDGWIHEADIHEVNIDNYGKFYKGTSNSSVNATSDPRITRPFIYGMCALFFAIGIISLIFGLWFFGIVFIAISIFAYYKSKKDIDKIEVELKNDKNYDTSDEGKKKIQKEFVDSINTEWIDIKKQTFTKNNLKKFTKSVLPIYIIIVFIITILLGIFVNIFLGIILFIVLLSCGFIYFWIISKIFKWEEVKK